MYSGICTLSTTRKSVSVKRNNLNTLDSFIVARILKFKTEEKEIKLKVGLFYRPENMFLCTGKGIQTKCKDQISVEMLKC